MNGNPFALAVGQTTSSREPDHSFISAKRNYTNLVFMQAHQNRHEEHRNLIKVLISLAKTWYNSWKTEEVSLPAGLIFLYSPREGKRQILAQPDNVPWPRPEREVLWEAWLCWAVPAPGCCTRSSSPWLGGTHVNGCAPSSLTALHPAREYFLFSMAAIQTGKYISCNTSCGCLWSSTTFSTQLLNGETKYGNTFFLSR